MHHPVKLAREIKKIKGKHERLRFKNYRTARNFQDLEEKSGV